MGSYCFSSEKIHCLWKMDHKINLLVCYGATKRCILFFWSEVPLALEISIFYTHF